jgi:hypothetical protein
MRSQRARRYLERLTRRSHIDDLGVIRRAFEEAGVTAPDALLAFTTSSPATVDDRDREQYEG